MIKKLFITTLLSFTVFLVSSCKDSKKPEATYFEESKEEKANSVKEAFNSKQTTKITPEIEALFEELGKASRREDEIKLGEFFSIESMLASIE